MFDHSRNFLHSFRTMGGTEILLDDDSREAEREARLIIYNPWVMLGGQSVFAIILVLIYFFFRPVWTCNGFVPVT